MKIFESLLVFDKMKQWDISKIFQYDKFVISNTLLVEQGNFNLLINKNKNHKKIIDQLLFII